MEYPARIVQEGKYILATFPDCPGCQTFVSRGGDIRSRAADALAGWLETALSDGDVPVPPRIRRARRGEKLIGVPVPLPLAVRLQFLWVRKRGGLSQADVARTAGVSQQQIARLESTGANPTIGMLERVARGLGLKLTVRLDRQPIDNR